MNWNGYELSGYRPEDLEEVLEVLSFLWGAKESNRQIFI
jgi:hypothetical protein